MDAQVIELIGRNRLVSELLRDGLEVAAPARDRGIDLIAYADRVPDVPTFIACPIQMKAASNESFSVDRKYSNIANLIIAYVWHIHDPDKTVTYALTYNEVRGIAEKVFDLENSVVWRQRGYHATSKPSRKLLENLEPHRMTDGKWWQKVTGQPRIIETSVDS
ncbi:MAG: hypothetical protein ACRD2U_06435 [Terriglobales bacterium]